MKVNLSETNRILDNINFGISGAIKGMIPVYGTLTGIKKRKALSKALPKRYSKGGVFDKLWDVFNIASNGLKGFRGLSYTESKVGHVFQELVKEVSIYICKKHGISNDSPKRKYIYKQVEDDLYNQKQDGILKDIDTAEVSNDSNNPALQKSYAGLVKAVDRVIEALL